MADTIKGIEKFLKEAPESYDFSDDCTMDESYKEKEGYDKYFEYHKNSRIGDPDLKSTLLQDIYKVLYPKLLSEEYMISQKGMYSDTMTSAKYTMNKFYRDKFVEDCRKYRSMVGNPRQHISILMCNNMYEQFPDVKRRLNDEENLKKFISLYHTLGNYTPVPVGFNVARSGGGAFDYWDLTLMKIKEYYDSQNNLEVLKQLLRCKDEAAEKNCILWLNRYHTWDEFIKCNYFQDYVEGFENSDAGKAGNVIPFCKGHSWECNEISDYDEFFKTVAECIEKRSKRMIRELKNKLAENVS